MRKYILFMLTIYKLLLFDVINAKCDEYRVTVSRESSNIYRIIGKDIYIMTKYCYEYVYYEEALLRMFGYKGEIVFLESGGKCDVDGVFGAVVLNDGDYKVTITMKETGWYEVEYLDLLIKSSICLRICMFEEVVLRIKNGWGKIIFEDGSSCYIDGIYKRLSL